jgi:DNA primase
MEGRIVIPIYDENGFSVAYAGRSLDQTEPHYRFPARFRKSLLLFNLHRAITEGKTAIVVEGFFDCFKVHQAGLPGVVALMGCSLSLRQEKVLCECFREVILLLDGDKAGQSASATIAQRLVSKVATRIVEIPVGSQPDQLGADQIRCSLPSRLFLRVPQKHRNPARCPGGHSTPEEVGVFCPDGTAYCQS